MNMASLQSGQIIVSTGPTATATSTLDSAAGTILFDEFSKIRILNPTLYDESEKLGGEINHFIKSRKDASDT